VSVTLILAHPLSPFHAARLGLEEKDYAVGARVEFHPDAARSVISAGYAQVDPESPAQVKAAIDGEPDKVVEMRKSAEQSGGFNPSETGMTVERVKAYLDSGVDDVERERVIAAERAGQNRTGIVG
jgi:hypothetical protein